MIRHLLCLAALTSALTSVFAAGDGRLRDDSTERRTLRFSGAGTRSIAVRNIIGSIHVKGSQSGNEAQLDVKRTVFADSEANLRLGQRQASLAIIDERADIEVVVRDEDGRACGDEQQSFRSRRRERPPFTIAYDLTVSVPENTRLVLCTINGSTVDVTDTRGDFEIKNVNGAIAMHNVRGSGSATTVNGRVEATLLEVPRQDAQFETVNGDVTVTWPAALAADLHLKTMNGGLFTDFDVTPLAAAATPGVRRGSRFVYRSDRTAHVRVGQGGPQLRLESLNGDVRVLRASR